MIQVKQYHDVLEFLKENEDSMLQNESINNLILGLANRMKNLPEFGDGKLFYSILRDGQTVGQALRSHVNKPLAVTRMKEDEVRALVDHLESEKLELHGVIGPLESSELFSTIWSRKSKLDMHQGVYELTELIMPKIDEMQIHQATDADLSVCRQFLEGFIRDAFPDDENIEDRAQEIAERNIKAKSLYLLKDKKNRFVSMAGKVRESKNAGTVSLVYTPNELRGNGYGSLVTAMVSKEVLDSGKEKCNLFTDLSNPTSNSIYSKIGYKKIGESKHFSFYSLR